MLEQHINGFIEYCKVSGFRVKLSRLRRDFFDRINKINMIFLFSLYPEHPWPRPLAQTWLARAGFYDFGSPSIATTALYSRQLAPGQAALQGLSSMVTASEVFQPQHNVPCNSRQGRPVYPWPRPG